MNNNKKVGIHTLGCRVNLYESNAIAELLKKEGFEITKSDDADYNIVNTCAVTAESERKSRQLVRRCAGKAKTLVIGCGAQLSPESYDIDNVIYIGGNINKSAVADIIAGNCEYTRISVEPMDNAPYEDMCITEKDELFSECRSFIKIQDGCNGKCAYCIIPKCRGKVRSRDFEDIISEAKRIVSLGYSEIILTGIEVGAYNKVPLSTLIEAVGKTDGLVRLRLGSLSPNVVSDTFLKAVSSVKCFMPHIHLSLQSCCDSVLERMSRPYRKKDIFNRVNAIRQYIPNCMISADIIVGFPGESEDDFIETLEALNELDIFHVHSFPYSEREGTPAADMDRSIPKSIRSKRNVRLIEANKQTRRRLLDSKIGSIMSVLIEKVVDGYAYGHTEEFLEAKLIDLNYKVGDFIEFMAREHDGEYILGDAFTKED